MRFLASSAPPVMISNPEAVRALYSESETGLLPGRTFSLGPVLGMRSILLQEGGEHLQRRRLMLPPFNGGRVRAYL